MKKGANKAETNEGKNRAYRDKTYRRAYLLETVSDKIAFADKVVDLCQSKYAGARLLYCGKTFLQVGDNIVDMFRADGKSNGSGGNLLVGKLFLCQLGVRRRGRMDDK